jgi:hypothetical protein
MAALVAILPLPTTSQQRFSDADAVAYFHQLTSTHPDALLRSDMAKWREEGAICFVPGYTGARAGIRMLPHPQRPGTLCPTIGVSERFITGTFVPSHKRTNNIFVLERQAVISHEYRHLRDHFDGTYRLTGEVTNNPGIKEASFLWEAEKSGFGAEWQFLKRFNALEILVDPTEIAKKGEQLVFLERFWTGLQPHPGFERLKPFLQKLYEADKQRVIATLQ